MNVRNAIATLMVRDAKVSRPWYESLFDRAPDSEPMQGLSEWRFPGGGWLQVVEEKERAGHGSVTLSIVDIEATLSHLVALGIAVDRSPSSSLVEIALCTDPDGNCIVFAEPSSDTIAQ